MADRDRRSDERPDPDEGFLQRWSRRKVEARSAADAATADPSGAAEGRPAALEQTPETAPGEPAPVAPEDLPAIESLDASSDFSVFMRPGVPEHLRTQALRKLWRTDPIFSKIDGLLEYGEDYSIPSWPKGAIRTAYQIGRGFVNELEKLGGADVPPERAAPAPEPTGDADAAITSTEANASLDPGAITPERTPGSTAAGISTASAAPSAPARPRPRPLPRRG
jgi:Protein of unknown function (DUF3306)